jgi:hypothetical protein
VFCCIDKINGISCARGKAERSSVESCHLALLTTS